jgi:hypothetical protein
MWEPFHVRIFQDFNGFWKKTAKLVGAGHSESNNVVAQDGGEPDFTSLNYQKYYILNLSIL